MEQRPEMGQIWNDIAIEKNVQCTIKWKLQEVLKPDNIFSRNSSVAIYK